MHQGPLDDHNEIASLSEITMGAKFSGFGVILDSTRAIRVNSRQAVEYNTQIKIIDKSMNPSLVTGQSSKGYVTFFMYWSSEDNQPFPHKIGDIIRFNHFEPEQFRGYLQGKNKKGSSWCIYHGDSANNEPYCFSTDFKDKMTQYHVQKLHEYRQWGTTFFQQHSLRNLDWYSYERHVDNPSVQTFDMLLRVEEIRLPSDESTGLFLILVDNKMQKFQTHVNAIHAKFLKEGEIVKLRSIEAIDGGKYLKGNQKYFAVLGIPDHYRDAQEFTESITIQESQIERMEEEGGEDLNQVPGQYTNFDPAFFTNRGLLLPSGSRLSSAVSSRRKDLPKKTAFETLKELGSQEPDRIIKENHKFHMRLTLIDIRPKSLSEALRYECRICRQIRRLDAPEGQVCCSRPMEKQCC